MKIILFLFFLFSSPSWAVEVCYKYGNGDPCAPVTNSCTFYYWDQTTYVFNGIPKCSSVQGTATSSLDGTPFVDGQQPQIPSGSVQLDVTNLTLLFDQYFKFDSELFGIITGGCLLVFSIGHGFGRVMSIWRKGI